MIDPITIGAAFAVAKGAVAGVKQAIELGHEIKDCYEDLQKFFHSQGEIEKAAKAVEVAKAQPKSEDPKEAAAQESILSQAFTIVMARKQAKEAEIQLRDIFAMKGELGLYQELCQERDRLSGEQDESNREAIRKARLAKDRAARKKEELEQTLSVIAIVIFLCIGGILLYVAITSRG